jgi:hypothetical protein
MLISLYMQPTHTILTWCYICYYCNMQGTQICG